MTYGEDFDVARTQGNLTDTGAGTWEIEENRVLYEFSEGTGDLSVISELSTYALLFGA